VPSREETFGMVIMEACAAGKCVVVFDKAPMNRVAARGPCSMVAPFDVPAYAEAMRHLLRSPDQELLEKGRTCRAWGAGTNWDEMARRQEAFYERVVAAHADSRQGESRT
jgi:hypothetical protein